MARMNTRGTKPRNMANTPVNTTTGRAFTAEGGMGWQRTPKGELFLAAVTSLNEDTFYETADKRAQRIQALAASPEIVNSPEWTLGMVRWLRQEVGLRSITGVVAMTVVKARLDAGLTGTNRQIIEAAISRLDEASDMIAGWMSLYGRNIPSCVRRGVADALRVRLSERSYLKWAGRMNAGSVTLRDVINLTHPKPKNSVQEALIKLVLDESYGKKGDDKQLPTIRAYRQFLAMDRDAQIRALTGPDAKDVIRKAALTHEVIAGAIGTIPADVWETLVPEMGYMALRMNLRRIEASGASRALIATINERLSDVDEAAKSRTMPVAFYAAYKNAPLAFAAALQDAANASLENVPALKGRTLVLLDRSGSMSYPMSAKSSLSCQDTANVFASALAIRGESVRVVAFDDHMEDVKVASTDLLRVVDQMPTARGCTYTPDAVAYAHKKGEKYDRIIILTDEQYRGGSVDNALDTYAPRVPVFTWNLAGYATAQMEAREGRWTFGGLSDKGFQMIPLLERGIGQSWPWETETTL
mgnify:FL=1|jgi:hypothetical protein